MMVTVLLGGHLRTEAKEGPQQRTVELPEGAAVRDLCDELGLAEDRIKMIFVNGSSRPIGTRLSDGDRVGLFPPELAYNTFVAVSYRKENAEARAGKDQE